MLRSRIDLSPRARGEADRPELPLAVLGATGPGASAGPTAGRGDIVEPQLRQEPLTSPANLPGLRYRSQLLAGSPFDHPADTVAWFGAVQAQDYASALWAVGQRTLGGTERSVEQALADGRIVRTWPLRGTLHLVAARDVHWLLALLGPRVVARSARRFAQLGLDERVVERAKHAFVRALAGGARLTRPEMRRVLDGAGVDTSGQRGYHLLWRCAVDGLLCLGPRQGKQHTFVLLDEWVPPGPTWTRDEALAEVARRYAQAHGPATLRDLTWWSGLAAAEARRAVALAGNGLVAHDGALGSPRTPADAARHGTSPGCSPRSTSTWSVTGIGPPSSTRRRPAR